MKHLIKSIAWIILALFSFTSGLDAQTSDRRAAKLDHVATVDVWNNAPLDLTADSTSAGVYVGDIYLPSVRIFYKGDDNTAGANSLDVDVKFETWSPTVGWKVEDHWIVRGGNATSWTLAQAYNIMPRVTATTITNPGAGNPLSYTASANNDSKLWGLKFVFTTDATVDDRWVRVGIFDGSDNIVALFMCDTAQPASKSIIYSFHVGAANIYQDDPGTATVALPSDLYMREDYYIATNIFAMKAGDAITNGVISSLVDADPLLGYHLPVMADSLRFNAVGQSGNGSDEDFYLTWTGQYLRTVSY